MNEAIAIANLAAMRVVVPPTAPSDLFLEFFQTESAATRAQAAGRSRIAPIHILIGLLLKPFTASWEIGHKLQVYLMVQLPSTAATAIFS